MLNVNDALDNTTTYTWSNGLKQTTTDALSRVTTNNWDSGKRRLLSKEDALGGVTTFSHDAAGNVIGIADALGRFSAATFDGNRHELTRTKDKKRETAVTLRLIHHCSIRSIR